MYKNWEAITEVMSYHRPLGLVLATLDLEKENVITRKLVKTFQSCFSVEQKFAPVPLSAILEKAKQMGCVSSHSGVIPISNDFKIVPEHIPLIKLGFTEDGIDIAGDRLPDTVSTTVKIGDFIAWNQGLYVVLEALDWGLITIAPAECILVDC